MGQFSWITQDTNEAIRERYSCDDRRKTRAYMHDNKGNVWEEPNYEGYGVFGGKDYYQLMAEMNDPDKCNGDVDHDRGVGIEMAFDKNPAIKYIYPNLTRYKDWEWIDEEPENDPNQGWGGPDDEEEDYWREEEDYW